MFSNERATRRKGRERVAVQLTLIRRTGRQLPCFRSSSPQDMQQERGYWGNTTDDIGLCSLQRSWEVTWS